MQCSRDQYDNCDHPTKKAIDLPLFVNNNINLRILKFCFPDVFKNVLKVSRETESNANESQN